MNTMNEKNGKTDILIYGPGGVGGLLAGALIRQYKERVAVIARGARLERLKQKGLTLYSDAYGDFTVYPSVVTDDPSGLPVQKLILICVKNGDLEEAAERIAPVTDEETCVIPVMNGVTAGDTLRRTLKKGIVCDSVIYTVSGTDEDFAVREKGPTRLLLGAPEGDTRAAAAAVKAEEVLRGAGISCRYRQDAQKEIWKKFVLNCAYNVVSARHGIPVGAVAKDSSLTEDYRRLMEEAWLVGRSEGVELAEDVVDKFMGFLPTYDMQSGSSLSRDFAAHRKGEMDIFGGVILEKAKKNGVPVPVTERYYRAMQEMTRDWQES